MRVKRRKKMGNIDGVFEEYKGHVFSFEFDPNAQIKLMKCYFNPEWEIEQEGIIVKKKDNLTYLITKDPTISFVDMLGFISQIIRVNIEREEKIKLLTEKKRQLDELFNSTSLDDLIRLDFNIRRDDVIPEIKIIETEEVSVSSETKKVE
jgi:hypothetical protein